MGPTADQLLRSGIAQLRAAGVERAEVDAKILLALALRTTTDRLILKLADQMQGDKIDDFQSFITQRAARTPLSHITGQRAFYGENLFITPAVLDPRPETETLVDAAFKLPFESVLDIGTGSGCIITTLLRQRPNAQGTAVDISTDALEIAQKNADHLGVSARLNLMPSDCFAAITDQQFDLIVSNPPYITQNEMAGLSPEVLCEPTIALTDFADGLSFYKRICAGAAQYLKQNGVLMVEIGAGQGGAVQGLFEQNGYKNITWHPDLDGRTRVISGQKSTNYK